VNRYHRGLPRATAVVAIAAIVAVGFQAAHAATGQRQLGATAPRGQHLTRAAVTYAGPALKSPSFSIVEYADAGSGPSCTGGADSIDEFSSSGGAPIQNFKTTANECAAYFGSNYLAGGINPKGAFCIVLADVNAGAAPGNWDSFIVDKSNGNITAQASTKPDTYKIGKTIVSGTPSDVQAVPNSQQFVGSDVTGNLELIALNPKTCAIKSIKGAAGGSTMINSTIVPDTAHPGRYDAVASDAGANAVQTFTLTPFKHTNTTAASVAGGADGIYSAGNTIATGSAQTTSQLEVGSSSAPGGTSWSALASDPNGYNTSDVLLIGACLWGGNEGGTSPTTVSSFTPPGYGLNNSQPVLNGSPYVGPMTQVPLGGGTNGLLVDNVATGVLDLSVLGSDHCTMGAFTPFASFTDPNGYSAGMLAAALP